MSYLLLLPEIVLVACALILPAIDSFSKRKNLLPYFSMAGLVVNIVIILGWMDLIPLLELFDLTVPATVFGGMLEVNAFSLLFKLLFSIVTLGVVIVSVMYTKDDPNKGEYYALLLLATVGMMVVASATDLITLVIGLETASLSSYALVGFRKRERRGSEAAMKYFVIGALSSAILLYGISFLYGITGTTDIGTIASEVQGRAMDGPMLVAIIAVIVGFGFKVAAAPFHMWAPDVYEGAPTSITAFLAAGSKKMGFVAFFKVFLVGLIALRADWNLAFGIIAVLTMTVGNVLAIQQESIKRMLAYSSIAQAGYLLMALAVGTEYGLTGGIFHIMTHVFMKGGAFVVVLMTGMLLIGDRLEDYKGLRAKAPVTAFCMAVFMLSLAGIPPFGGFASKFVLFSSAVEEGGWLLWLAVIAVLNSALSLYYYARVLKHMYVLDGRPLKRVKEPRSLVFVLVLAVIAIVLMGVFPGPFIEVAREAARVLMPLP